MKWTLTSHHYGHMVVPPALLKEVQEAISGTNVAGPKMTKQAKKGILGSLHKKGWSDEVILDPSSNITITSAKNKVGLCLQTGNVGRMYADLLKLQTLYARGSIVAGMMVVPTLQCAKLMGKNLTSHERLVSELHIFDRIISAPIAVIGIES